MTYTSRGFEVDPHIHTAVSGHSWSTLGEYAAQAAEIGLKGFCITEHGCMTPGGPPEWITHTQRMLPKYYRDIRIYKGLEANIAGADGGLDIRDKYLENLEFCIASIHSFAFKSGSIEENTSACIHALENKFVDMIGHPDNTGAPCNIEELVLTAKRMDKPMELNNSSLTAHRKNCADNVAAIIKLCRKHDVRLCVSSDAHFHIMIGDFELACALLNEMRFPPELVLNYRFETFAGYIAERVRRLGR